MSLHDRDEREFSDRQLESLLKTWVLEAPKPEPVVREQILRHAASLRWLRRGESWRAWMFSFGLLSPEYHRVSHSYDWLTFQNTRFRLVL
ncbi:MAG: hypothetical protein Fur0018_00600 [Anaerolineales bacterium]